VDGVTLVAGDEILVKTEATGSQNGWYVVSTLNLLTTNGTRTRLAGYDTSAEVQAPLLSEGIINGNASYALTTDAPITLNHIFDVHSDFWCRLNYRSKRPKTGNVCLV
jgi:hypothetical protein